MHNRIYHILLLIVFFVSSTVAQQQESPNRILFKNINVWNGTNDKLVQADVLIEDHLIKEIKLVLCPY